MNGNAFIAYVEQILAPSLKSSCSQCPQGAGRARSDRGRRRKAALSASLFAGFQSDRATLRKNSKHCYERPPRLRLREGASREEAAKIGGSD
jgi:hypothetical protein